MKIQFITTVFNGMAQRLWIELDRLKYEVKGDRGQTIKSKPISTQKR